MGPFLDPDFDELLVPLSDFHDRSIAPGSISLSGLRRQDRPSLLLFLLGPKARATFV
jgi:hypothetical protein